MQVVSGAAAFHWGRDVETSRPLLLALHGKMGPFLYVLAFWGMVKSKESK